MIKVIKTESKPETTEILINRIVIQLSEINASLLLIETEARLSRRQIPEALKTLKKLKAKP